MNIRRKIVVLSGAGISAESGIPTFRASDGLWENHRIEDVATPEAWERNPDLVQDFYNQRRKQALSVQPNAGHLALVKLEEAFDVTVITQNVDNLHEKAGSTHVIHLHGELFKSRSTVDESLVYDIDGWEIRKGDVCEKGAQLRPHIVWFGEAVPMMDVALEATAQADILIVVGTSLNVYPAAGLAYAAPDGVPLYIVDPNTPTMHKRANVTFITEPATIGLTALAEQLLATT
ncbi:SIR2 family NAD-dependent protein deacylase [Spirosoma utsteinense]|uniref:NAD-dependent protein deacylase n=1 Tax=Spirosoma utsteinense TaxID=2585773 RepID=A0ABR6W620_9BACT|nr:NAD-dependent deacylase [Spirosoma utsteinense]MBC3785822.1 NAD-dependent deacetylase [Spirosoma utsteinense]MBC3791994.1 NAD-dependent deacetylase [Spirosoma utsteinense]